MLQVRATDAVDPVILRAYVKVAAFENSSSSSSSRHNLTFPLSLTHSVHAYLFDMMSSVPTHLRIYALAAIAVSLFLEWVLIVLNWEIPAEWLPMYTTAQIVDILHLLLPICLHGSRCILNAFYVNTDENKIAFVKRRVAESIGQREAFRRLNRWALNTLPLGGEGVATEAKDVSSSSGNSANDHHNDNDRSDDVGHSTQSDDGKGRMAAANTDSEKWRNEMAVYRAGVVRGKWWQLQEAVFREKVASASPCVASDRSDRSESITQLQLQEHVDLEKRLSAVAKGSRLRVLPVTRLTFSSRWSWLLQISLYVATCYIFKR